MIEVNSERKEIFGHHLPSKRRDSRAESHTERAVLQEFPGLCDGALSCLLTKKSLGKSLGLERQFFQTNPRRLEIQIVCSGYPASSFQGVRPRSDRSQSSRNSESGERGVQGKMTSLKEDQGRRHKSDNDKCTRNVGLNKSSMIGVIKKAAESRSSRGEMHDQRGPVRSKGRRFQNLTTKIRDISSSLDARVVKSRNRSQGANQSISQNPQ
ncbi:hypothetical protein TNCV_2904971 [Trichonephila clavipes]|nr:hypothetical protein TNCV_2904971 [Trichonephila clavipes]